MTLPLRTTADAPTGEELDAMDRIANTWRETGALLMQADIGKWLADHGHNDLAVSVMTLPLPAAPSTKGP